MEINININESNIQNIIKQLPINNLLNVLKYAEIELKNRKATPIDKLNVGVRALRIFKELDIIYIEQLSEYKYEDFVVIRQAGKKTLIEIIEAASTFGIEIKYCEKCKGFLKIWDGKSQKHVPCPNCV